MNGKEANRQEGRLWLSWLVLLLLMGVALVLRWRYVQEISLFVDEFVTAWAARNVLARGLPIFPSGNVYPHGFVFTYLVVPFVLGEFNETLVRIPGLIVGLAGLPVAYWVGRRFFSDRVGLVAAAAMAVDPDHIVWGSRARMYGLLQLFTLLVVYVYYRGLADDRPRDRYLAMGLLTMAIFVHAEAAFLLPVLGLATLVVCPWRRLLRWSVVLPFALAAVGAGIFFLIAKFGQPGHLETLQESRPYLAFSAQLLRGPQAFAPVFASIHRLPLSLLSVVGLYFIFRPHFHRSSPLTYLYVVVIAFIALLVLLAGATWQRERYLFMVLPLLFLIGGEVLWHLLDLLPIPHSARFWQPALVALLVALFVGLSGAHTAYAQEWGYDQAYRYLRDEGKVGPDDRVVSLMPTGAMLYLGQLDQFAIQRAYKEFVINRPQDGLLADLWTATPLMTDTVSFTDLLSATPRVWFIADGWRFQTRYEPDFILTVLEQMDLEFDARGVLVFRGEGYTPPVPPAFQRDLWADFGGELALTGVGLTPEGATPNPGEELEVTLYWQALDGVMPAYTAILHLVAPDGTSPTGLDEAVLAGFYQPDLWPRDVAIPDGHRLALPSDLPPGRYRLELGLYHPGQPDGTLIVENGDRLALASLTVGIDSAAPQPAERTDIDFGEQIRLLGYDLQRDNSGPQGMVHVTLHWQSLAAMDRDYTVFVHLVGPDGVIVAQDDAPPGDPFFPTSTWLPGDFVSSSHELALPANTPPGDYALLVGLYHQPTAERLQAIDSSGLPLGDAPPLVTIRLDAESP
jgi:hypothetical protein